MTKVTVPGVVTSTARSLANLLGVDLGVPDSYALSENLERIESNNPLTGKVELHFPCAHDFSYRDVTVVADIYVDPVDEVDDMWILNVSIMALTFKGILMDGEQLLDRVKATGASIKDDFLAERGRGFTLDAAKMDIFSAQTAEVRRSAGFPDVQMP